MNTYVMSDIHGEFDRFQSMLDMIQASDDDQIIILGDAIDRNPDGVKILMHIMAHDNMTLIRGNHEQMAIDAMADRHGVLNDVQTLWRNNGGSCTRRELLYKTSMQDRINIMRFLRKTATDMTVTVNHQEFYLVHGWPNASPEDKLWGRPDGALNQIQAPVPGKITIIGHTPVCYLVQPDNPIEYIHQLEREHKHMMIQHGNGVIAIDCGCGNKTETRRLACICLNTMEEFYA